MKALLLVAAAAVGLAAIVALVVLVERPGDERTATDATASTATGSPPLPPPSAVVLAREAGDQGVALAAQPSTLRVTVLAPTGGGASGLRVLIDGRRARACVAGCYEVDGPHPSRVAVAIGGRLLRFVLPPRAPAAADVVARATHAFRRLRSVSYVERLASSPRNRIVSTFTLEAPDRLRYRIHGGATATVIGTRRWDGCTRSTASTLQQPTPVWGLGPVVNAHLLRRTRGTLLVSFLVPGVPAWFTVRLERRTLLPRTVDMTATAHFMHHTYFGFDAPRRIFPPRC